MSTDNVTDYKIKITNLQTVTCALSNIGENTVILFRLPYDHIPLIHTFPSLVRKLKKNSKDKSTKNGQNEKTNKILERFIKSIEYLNVTLGNPFPNLFKSMEATKGSVPFIMDRTMLKAVKVEVSTLDKIKERFSTLLQEALLELLNTLIFEFKVFESLNEEHCAFLQNHGECKNISGPGFYINFTAAYFLKLVY